MRGWIKSQMQILEALVASASRIALPMLFGTLLASSVSAYAQTQPTPPVVSTENGPVAGLLRDDAVVYWNIPYASAKRWEQPQSPQNWSEVRKSLNPGPICPQREAKDPSLTATQSEDCLNLNVWVPRGNHAKPLPVMFWIHGGSFRVGSGGLPIYNGEKIASQDVILVTINYRLGLLGRFAHPDLSKEQVGQPRGNYGLMDQIAALKWVKQNIASFGGDPDNVTIFGFSAGGVAVNYLMAAPSAHGLFAKAISQSGGIQVEATRHISEQRPGMPEKPLESEGLATAAHFGSKDQPMTLGDLRKVKASDLVAYQEKTLVGSLNPVVDGILIPDDIGRTFRDGKQAKVPYMAGSTSWEASLLHYVSPPLPPVAILAGIRNLDSARKAFGGLGDAEMAMAWFADSTFLGTAHYLTNANALAGQPTWLYLFDYLPQAKRGTVPGTEHGDEVPYIFGTLPGTIRDLSADQITEEDLHVSSLMTAYWTNFAKNADPNGSGLPILRPRKPSDGAMNIIDQNPHTVDNFLKNRMDFLDQYYNAHMDTTKDAAP